ncbi:hypothetical protein B4096_3043 [Heyndrickxia coagulans]|jgi:hypothetical protein|nr:hypothetical protein B4096_3043 [Heyndrickxia coagulans]
MFFSEKGSLFLFVLPVAMSILIVIDYVAKNFNSYYTAPSEKNAQRAAVVWRVSSVLFCFPV